MSWNRRPIREFRSRTIAASIIFAESFIVLDSIDRIHRSFRASNTNVIPGFADLGGHRVVTAGVSDQIVQRTVVFVGLGAGIGGLGAGIGYISRYGCGGGGPASEGVGEIRVGERARAGACDACDAYGLRRICNRHEMEEPQYTIDLNI